MTEITVTNHIRAEALLTNLHIRDSSINIDYDVNIVP